MQTHLPRLDRTGLRAIPPERLQSPLRLALTPASRAVQALCWVGLALHTLPPALAQAQLPAGALPSGLVVKSGQAQLTVNAQQMTVRNSPGAILEWQRFDIGSGQRVHFDQVGAQSKVLNRVTGNAPSSILGQLTSNGQVWLLNPNGVLFGRDARVDVGSLVVSTLRLNDNDFLAGRYRFDTAAGAAAPAGTVRNEGELRSSLGGQVLLLGTRVENAGTIDAPAGHVGLFAAERIELVDTGAPNLVVQLERPAGEVLNLGQLRAAGGRIDLHAAIVNQQGVVRADALGLDAQGQVVLKASDSLTLAEGSLTSANAAGAGAVAGQVDLDAGNGTLWVSGQVQALGEQGLGGGLRLQGRQIGLLDMARLDASGAAGGGEVLVGGGLQGRDPRLNNAQAVYMAPGASIQADATVLGDGGRIVLWSDQATRAYGGFSARGAAAGGEGGFVETSGGWLDARPSRLDLSAPAGRAGQWLLDPNNIFISNVPENNISPGPDFSSTGDTAALDMRSLAAALNAGTSVTVATGNGGANTQAGNITIQLIDSLSVAPPNPVTLTFRANQDVIIRSSTIESTASPLTMIVEAAGSGTAGRVLVHGSTIATRGGDVRLGGTVSTSLPWPASATKSAVLPFALGYTTAAGDNYENPLSISQSTITLGGGSFSAYGSGGARGVEISESTVQAGAIRLAGRSTGADSGVEVRYSTVTATDSMLIEGGGGRNGVFIYGGSRLVLDTPGRPANTLRIWGSGGSRGVVIYDQFNDGYRGTAIQVVGGQLNLVGETNAGAAADVEITGAFGAGTIPVPPTLDLSLASTARISAQGSNSQGGLSLTSINIAGPDNGPGLFLSNDYAGPSLNAGGTGIVNIKITQANSGTNIEGRNIYLGQSDLTLQGLNLLTHPAAGPISEPVIVRDTRVTSSFGGLFIQGSNGSLTTSTAGTAITLDRLTANVAASIRVEGVSDTGTGIALSGTSLVSTGSSVGLRGTSRNVAIDATGASRIEGGQVQVFGSGAVRFSSGAAAKVTATDGELLISATTPVAPLQPAIVSVAGDWTLTASRRITLKSADGFALLPEAPAQAAPAVPHFRATEIVELQSIGAAGMTIDNANLWTDMFSTMPVGSELDLFAAGARSPININTAVQLAIPVYLTAGPNLPGAGGVVTFGPGASLSSTASGDAVGIMARALVNNAGAGALATPNGRWGVVLTDPAASSQGALSPAFTQYGMDRAAVAALPRDAQGNAITALPGNVLFYEPTVASLLAGAVTSLQATKAFDASATMPLDAARLQPGGSLVASGLLPGHSLSFGGTALGRFADAAVGVNKPITLDAATTWQVTDAQGKTILGYNAPRLTGDIVAASLPAAGPVAALALAGGLTPSVLAGGLVSVTPEVQTTSPAEGRALDASANVAPADGQASFAALPLATMSSAQQQAQLAARQAFKQQLFGGTLARLDKAPELAAVRPCKTVQELDSGICLITEALRQEAQSAAETAQWRLLGRRAVQQAALPQIERKLALLVGINAYTDPRIPSLRGAASDAKAVAELLSGALGYDTVLLTADNRRADVVRALNRLVLQARPQDSVLIYYAGHGTVAPQTGLGYWQPSDARVDDPSTWLANADIAQLVAQLQARQVMVVSDSCYSGSLAGPDAVRTLGTVRADVPHDPLARKAVVVMASGGNEPVDDVGRGNHSPFTWHLMEQLKGVPDWTAGGIVFDRVRDAVVREVSQTPRYGAASAAGHEPGADYVVERRSLQPATTTGK